MLWLFSYVGTPGPLDRPVANPPEVNDSGDTADTGDPVAECPLGWVRVPEDVATLKEALAIGDQVCLGSGAYPPLVLADRDVEILGIGVVLLDGGDFGRVLQVNRGSLTLAGVEVRGGFADFGAGLAIDEADVVLRDVVVRDNEASDYYTGSGGGIRATGGTLTLERVEVRNNRAAGDRYDGFGAGIAMRSVEARFDDVLIAHNSAEGGWDGTGYGGGLTMAMGSLVASRLRVVANHAEDGGGIWVGEQANATLIQAALAGNTAETGGPFWVGDAHLGIAHATVVGNTAEEGPGGWLENASIA